MRRRRILSLAVATGLFVGYVPLLAGAKDGRQIASETFPSIVLFVMNDAQGQPVSLGSGFFVTKDTIATNMHVVEKAASGYAKLVGREAKYTVAGTVGVDDRCDLVLLKLNDANAPTLLLADSSRVQVGDEVYAVGNPQGLEGTFSKGIVSGIRTLEDDTLLQITAPISPGSSGGPVLDANGRVIGVSVATFSGGQNLNFAIPASYLHSLMADSHAVKPLVAMNTPKAEASSMLDTLGDRSREGVIGTSFLWDAPALEDGEYSFSIQNRLQSPVKSIVCLVVFFSDDERPIDPPVA